MNKACRNLVLIGYRGAGKTSVGRAVAARLGWSFVDTDDFVEEREGRSIVEIFETRGESVFRDIESDVVEQLQNIDRFVVSAGGGVVLRDQNVQRLRRLGPIIWLVAPADALWQRIRQDESTAFRRPDLTAIGGLDEVRRVLADRTPIYQAAADHTVDTAGLSTEQVADRILALLCIDENDSA